MLPKHECKSNWCFSAQKHCTFFQKNKEEEIGVKETGSVKNKWKNNNNSSKLIRGEKKKGMGWKAKCGERLEKMGKREEDTELVLMTSKS